jgi:hypothetical protein
VSALTQLHWRPHIGDPGFLGWFTVVAYALGGLLALQAGRQADRNNNRERLLWFWVAGLMGFLCLNKQLDLQSLFTDLGRVLAREQGWYAKRRGVQEAFVLILLMGGGWLFFLAYWRFRSFWRHHALLLMGVFFTVTFIIVRATSFHHIDRFLGTPVIGMRINVILELSGIAMVAFASWQEIRQRQTRGLIRNDGE